MSDLTSIYTVRSLYHGIIISLVLLSVLQVPLIHVFGAFSLLGVLGWAYLLERKTDDRTLEKSHVRHIIRTIWVGSLYLVIGFMIAGYALYEISDKTMVLSMFDKIAAGHMMSEADINNVIQDYIQTNLMQIVTYSYAGLSVGMLWMLYRCALGLTRWKNGQGFETLKFWI